MPASPPSRPSSTVHEAGYSTAGLVRAADRLARGEAAVSERRRAWRSSRRGGATTVLGRGVRDRTVDRYLIRLLYDQRGARQLAECARPPRRSRRCVGGGTRRRRGWHACNRLVDARGPEGRRAVRRSGAVRPRLLAALAGPAVRRPRRAGDVPAAA